MLYNVLGKVESAPVLDMLVKEVTGINIPKVALTRSQDERRDAFYSEFGNTIGFFGAGLGINMALNQILNTQQLRKKSLLAYRWGVLGRSAAIFSTGFAILWAMPFIRNYLTAKKTGSIRFTQVIGAHDPQESMDYSLQHNLADSKRKSLAILGLGLGGTVLATAGSRLAIAKGWGKKAVNQLFKNPKGWIHSLTLKDGQFANFGRVPALLFWGVPAYGGWLHAARDSYERKEQLLKFVNFVTCFFGPSLLLQKHYEKKLKQVVGKKATLSYRSITRNLSGKTRDKALKIWATQSGVGMLSSIILLSTMPQLINIYLTRQRLIRAARNADPAALGTLPQQHSQPLMSQTMPQTVLPTMSPATPPASPAISPPSSSPSWSTGAGFPPTVFSAASQASTSQKAENAFRFPVQ